MYETAVSVIREYMDEYLFEPAHNWPRYEFKTRSYSIWAANEIINRINEEDMRAPQHITGRDPVPPLGIIHEFINELDRQMETDGTMQHQFILSTAKETAIDIILLFL